VKGPYSKPVQFTNNRLATQIYNAAIQLWHVTETATKAQIAYQLVNTEANRKSWGDAVTVQSRVLADLHELAQGKELDQ
jgi:uncharacterized protein (DUF488 family)